MVNRFSRRLLIMCVFGTIVTGCSSLTPFVQDYNIVPIQQEMEISNAMAAQISQEMSINTNANLNARVNTIGNRLVNVLPRKDYPYQFYVVDDPTPNAFTIPGGRIYVHTGLMQFVSDDHELAGVMAHEIGHAYEQHPVKGLSRDHGFKTLTSVLLRNNQSNRIQQAALQLARTGVLRKYGRDDERESDEIAFYLTRRAGYRTEGLLRFLRKLDQISKGGQVPTFFSSHPPTPERVARLESLNQQRL